MSSYGKEEMTKGKKAEQQAAALDLAVLFKEGVLVDLRWKKREGDFLLRKARLVEIKYDEGIMQYGNVPVEFANYHPNRLYRQDFRGWYYHAQEEGVEWIVYVLYRTYQDKDKDGKITTSEPEHCGAIAVRLADMVKYVEGHKEWLDKYRRREQTYERKKESCFWVVPLKDVGKYMETKSFECISFTRLIADAINSGKVELEVMPPRKHD